MAIGALSAVSTASNLNASKAGPADARLGMGGDKLALTRRDGAAEKATYNPSPKLAWGGGATMLGIVGFALTAGATMPLWVPAAFAVVGIAGACVLFSGVKEVANHLNLKLNSALKVPQ